MCWPATWPSRTAIPPTTSRRPPRTAIASRSPSPASREDDLNVEVKDRALVVSANKADEDRNRTYLHRGIATRAFERRFHLADHVKVTGATHANGMLHIDLAKELPEALKPRRIEIAKGDTVEAKAIETDTAEA